MDIQLIRIGEILGLDTSTFDDLNCIPRHMREYLGSSTTEPAIDPEEEVKINMDELHKSNNRIADALNRIADNMP